MRKTAVTDSIGDDRTCNDHVGDAPSMVNARKGDHISKDLTGHVQSPRYFDAIQYQCVLHPHQDRVCSEIITGHAINRRAAAGQWLCISDFRCSVVIV